LLALGVTYPAAKSNVDKLVEAGIVEPYGDAAYARRFWAPKVLEAIGN
jgi:DNA-binding MarR family transcriptional regulator